ncbi:MAG TPA: methyltransferase domain-containing protein [Vicinamibacteria bacterium]|nr:methyltransferase domain-containing protein [Vicinamibacteria bacterium]
MTRPRSRHRDKLDWLRGFVEGASLLYVGSVDRNADNHRKHVALHGALAGHAASALGVYASEAQAAELRGLGYDAVHADVEALELGRVFDVIAAPDDIEHLSNAGGFLDGMRRHLRPDGWLLVTTPNPTGLVRILEQLVRGRTKANVEHTGWYTGQVLDQLGRRHGLRVVEEALIDDMHLYHRTATRPLGPGMRLATRSVVLVNRVACGLLPQLSETFGFGLRRRVD